MILKTLFELWRESPEWFNQEFVNLQYAHWQYWNREDAFYIALGKWFDSPYWIEGPEGETEEWLNLVGLL